MNKIILGIKILGWGIIALALERLLHCALVWVAIELEIVYPTALLGILLGIAFYLWLLRVGFNTIHLKHNGRIATLCASWFFSIFGLIRLFFSPSINYVIMIILGTAYIYFFTRPKIKEHFNEPEWMGLSQIE